MKTLLAIDPGANGGIAVRTDDSTYAYPMPETEGDLLALLKEIVSNAEQEGSQTACYLENIVKHMGGGVPASTMAVYASNWGFIKGVLMALQVRLILVTPQQWQKQLGLGNSRGMKKTEWKAKLRGEAQRRFPQLKVTLKTADALLILDSAIGSHFEMKTPHIANVSKCGAD